MEILFNSFLQKHNKDELRSDGSYKLKKFEDKYPDTEIDFDPMEYIKKVHSEKYINEFKKQCDLNGYEAEINLSPVSFDCSVLAAGLAIKASKSGDFAVIRPAGHHARRDYGAGFCFFNNDAIVAKKLIDEGHKVAILDIDGHRGDGTQEILEDEESALCISLHQQGVYAGDGEPFTKNAINFPLPYGTKEDLYLETLKEAISHIKDFNPTIIGVCAGLDTFKEDHILDLKLEVETYNKIGKLLSQEFDNLFAFLAGGYHDKVLECVESFVSGVNDL